MQADFVRTSEPGVINPPLPRLPARVATADRNDRFSFGLLLVALALGAAVEALGPTWARTVFQSVKLGSLAGISALLAALAISIVLHEGGHLTAAILANFEVLGICLGPLRATRSHYNWKLQFSGKLLAGSISAVPRDTDGWRERVLVVVAGGPTATFMTALITGLIFFHCPVEGWIKGFLGASAELNCFLFVLGLVPNGRAAKVRNDARLFSIFWNDTVEAQEVVLYHLVTRLETAGVKPCDYPLGLIHAMATMQGRPESMLVYAHMIVLWAVDLGDGATARAWDGRALELCLDCSVGVQQATLARSACLDVLLQNDLASAKKKLAQVEIDVLNPAWFQHRTKAVHWLIEENIPEALAEISRAQYAFPKRLPYYEFERMLLRQLHRKALAVRPRDLSTFCRNRAA